jgi:hypothetical protein
MSFGALDDRHCLVPPRCPRGFPGDGASRRKVPFYRLATPMAINGRCYRGSQELHQRVVIAIPYAFNLGVRVGKANGYSWGYRSCARCTLMCTSWAWRLPPLPPRLAPRRRRRAYLPPCRPGRPGRLRPAPCTRRRPGQSPIRDSHARRLESMQPCGWLRAGGPSAPPCLAPRHERGTLSRTTPLAPTISADAGPEIEGFNVEDVDALRTRCS